MNGQRALEVLGSFESGQLAFTAKEIEELLKAELVMEADPDVFATLRWLGPVLTDHGVLGVEHPEAIPTLGARLDELTERLQSDWHRFATSAAHLAEEEEERRTLRRAISILKDDAERARLVRLSADVLRRLPPGARYRACEQLGDELYALTWKGLRARGALALRAERFASFPLSAFLKAFDKSEAKMAAFTGEITVLASRIGYVKKNPHQIVIGLAKTGLPAAQALDVYGKAVRQTGAPDVAVTVARNATAHGGPDGVAKRLRTAVEHLQHAGFPATPVTFGAAKTLLPFEPLSTGVVRLQALVMALEQRLGSRGEAAIKLAARLMPAEGRPSDLVQRAARAAHRLHAARPHRLAALEIPTAVALASMVRDDDAVDAVVDRFLAVVGELVRREVSAQATADGDALEAVSCAGSPAEVVETVRTLAWQLAEKVGRTPQHADVAIAVAFAKRFAY